VDATVLGGLEAYEEALLSNRITHGKKMPQVGEAMDLLVGTKKAIVAIEHPTKALQRF